MRFNAHAAFAALILCATVVAQVPTEVQGIRTDALVYVTDELGTRLPESAVTFVVPIGQALVTVYTDQNGVAYCGDRDSALSVFEFGHDSISFMVQRPGFVDAHVDSTLPPVENACSVNTKVCQTFHVRMVPTTGSVLPKEEPVIVKDETDIGQAVLDMTTGVQNPVLTRVSVGLPLSRQTPHSRHPKPFCRMQHRTSSWVTMTFWLAFMQE